MITPATVKQLNEIGEQLNGNIEELRDDVQERLQETKEVLKDMSETAHASAKYLKRKAKKGKKERDIKETEKLFLHTFINRKEAIRISRIKLKPVDKYQSASDWIGEILDTIMDNPLISMLITVMGGGGIMQKVKNYRLGEEKNKEHKRRKNIQRRHRKLVGRARQAEGKHETTILDDGDDDYDDDDDD